MDVPLTAPDGVVVSLHGAAKRYGRLGPWVLGDVSVRVDAGALIELRGANGSGKSTLLRLLAGISAPTRGRREAAPRLRIGYAPERLTPPPPFTAAAFIGHHVRLRGLDVAQGARAAHDLAERLALDRQLGERLSALSKGSLQKLVVIQALLGEPRLILLDEPFSGLDPDARAELARLLEERIDAGAAVVYSDHRDAPQAAADAVWQLAGGGVLELRDDPAGSERRRVVVAVDGSDAALRGLLADGWHIVAVASVGEDRVRVEARRERRR
jgi:ABC-type multidrug transport system ATPase subunit